MAHVNDHQSRLPVAQATVLALPPPNQAKVSVYNSFTRSVKPVNVSLVIAHHQLEYRVVVVMLEMEGKKWAWTRE